MKSSGTRVTCVAILTKKRELPYQDIASTKGIPVVRPIYEVTFTCGSDEILFSLSQFEYEVLAEGMKGTLIYLQKKHCNELISFTDDAKNEIIKEFTD